MSITRNINLSASKEVTIKVINQEGQTLNSYNITGNLNSKLGNQVKSQANIIEVLVNGVQTSLSNLKDMNFSAVNNVTILTQAGIGINADIPAIGLASHNVVVSIQSHKTHL